MISRWTRVLLVVVWSGVLLAFAGPVRGLAGGTITGRVVNGTSGGTAVGAGLVVTLRITDGDKELDALTTTTDADGAFRFGHLGTASTLSYRAEVIYSEITYAAAQAVSFAEGTAEAETTLTVYETGQDSSVVRLESVHMIAESFEQVLRISEVHVFGNVSDRTFVGQARDEAGGKVVTVFIPLPENAVGLAFSEDAPEGRYVEADGGIWDTEPVLPGAETSIVRFSYHLIVEGVTVPLERGFSYPVSTVNVLVVQPGLAVRGEQLVADQPVTFEDTEYAVYRAANLGVDTPLTLELEPTASSEQGDMTAAPTDSASASRPAGAGQQRLLRWLGLGLVVMAAAGAIVYPLARRPRGGE